MKSFMKKIALLFPAVRNVRTDLHNRRVRAEEFEAANSLLVSQLDVMKNQMSKAIELEKSAVEAKTTFSANAKHYEDQLAIMTAKYETMKEAYEAMETENCLLNLAIADLTRKNVEFVKKN